jgi:hypothetical protein
VGQEITSSNCRFTLLELFRLDADSHGQLLSVLSYFPAVLITPIVTGIALLLYAMGYSLTRPDTMVGGK